MAVCSKNNKYFFFLIDLLLNVRVGIGMTWVEWGTGYRMAISDDPAVWIDIATLCEQYNAVPPQEGVQIDTASAEFQAFIKDQCPSDKFCWTGTSKEQYGTVQCLAVATLSNSYYQLLVDCKSSYQYICYGPDIAETTVNAAPTTARDTTLPDTTVPDTTVPDTTVPDTTVPDTTLPDTTLPDTTLPDTTLPDTTLPDTTVPDTTVPHTTLPHTTLPHTTLPDTTLPDTTIEPTTIPLTVVPQDTSPESTQPESTQPESTQPDNTQPDSTQPDNTQPDNTQPDNTQQVSTQPEEIVGRSNQSTLVADNTISTSPITDVTDIYSGTLRLHDLTSFGELSWNQWTPWSACTTSCNGGQKLRLTLCAGKLECRYQLTSVRNITISYDIQWTVCNREPCPVDGMWLSWSEWSRCSATCGLGTRHRNRFCDGPYYGGINCDGDRQQNQYCDGNKRCPGKLPESPVQEETFTESDSRPSAIGVGVISLIFVLLELALVLMMDSVTIAQFFRQRFRRKQYDH